MAATEHQEMEMGSWKYCGSFYVDYGIHHAKYKQNNP